MWRPLALCGVRPEFNVLHSKLISHTWRSLLTGQGAEKHVDGSGLISYKYLCHYVLGNRVGRSEGVEPCQVVFPQF